MCGANSRCNVGSRRSGSNKARSTGMLSQGGGKGNTTGKEIRGRHKVVGRSPREIHTAQGSRRHGNMGHNGQKSQ